MRFESPRFGEVEVDESAVLHFERGLPGFPSCNRFIVMEHDRNTPLKWLQCVDQPDIAFLVVEPEQILGDYRLDVPDQILASLGWKPTEAPGSIAAFLILSVDGEDLFANLRAPVVVNVDRRRAVQMILEDPTLPVRHPIRPEA